MTIGAGKGSWGNSAVLEAPYPGNRAAAEAASSSKDVIRLELGESRIPLPPHILDAISRATHSGIGYTPTAGLPTLREAAASDLERRDGVIVDPNSQIAFSPGGTGAVFALLAALVEPGDEVLVPDPGWPNYPLIVSVQSARPIPYPCPATAGFLPDMDALETLVSPQTRVLIINTPNNPTGCVYPTDCVGALLDFAQRHGLWVLSDECYDRLVYGHQYSPPSTRDHDGRVVTAKSFSKTYSLSGWRVGYAIGPEPVVASVVKVLEATSSCVGAVAQQAAYAALTGPQDWVRDAVSSFRDRASAVNCQLETAGLRVARPGGALYVMADISATGISSLDFSRRLLQEEKVAVTPGCAFGAETADQVRISVTEDLDRVLEGVDRLVRLVNRLA